MYSKHCKEHGISMSKQIEKFIAQEVSKIEHTFETKLPVPTQDKINSEGSHPMKKFC
jgi:hypothetical protein